MAEHPQPSRRLVATLAVDATVVEGAMVSTSAGARQGDLVTGYVAAQSSTASAGP